ncbi:NAD(P)/FAD-dependent oxidoreductase [Qipengyuania nanhaisediminis]|uniref:NAD(P)/FAD-dependent oxidoreductase n=1 Tax=Qipengyuania nanhaisediminis TaxID=604088 RepID=UPI0038B40049
MRKPDVIVIGAGIAGLSLAAAISSRARVMVIEAESAPGYHASGRSVAFAHFGLGDGIVRTLTAMSMNALARGTGPGDAPFAQVHPALHLARRDQRDRLDWLAQVHQRFVRKSIRLSGEEARTLLPILKVGPEQCYEALLDTEALKLDTDAMLQAHRRDLLRAGGEVLTGARVSAIGREKGLWHVETPRGPVFAPVLVNAAGAWADVIARLAGVTPIGIEPRRRTVIALRTPGFSDVANWPFAKTVGEGFYVLPEGKGRLLASAMDETASDPCDAVPEEIDVALAAHRITSATDLAVRHIPHSWAGLRSFAPDELPVVGFSRDAPGFFWFAGQGGFGFQTAPALARAGAALLEGRAWPAALEAAGISAPMIAPARLGA